jgi:hypothetical protein
MTTKKLNHVDSHPFYLPLTGRYVNTTTDTR